MPTPYQYHDDATALVNADAARLFEHLDDQRHLSAHMSKSSWMMFGSRMTIATDEGGGRRVGSRLTLTGMVIGIPLEVAGVVTRHEPPRYKAWETEGKPRLLVIGAYRMALEITPIDARSSVRVSIDYDLPDRGISRWVGKLLGRWYARWCVGRMVSDAARHFSGGSVAPTDGEHRETSATTAAHA